MRSRGRNGESPAAGCDDHPADHWQKDDAASRSRDVTAAQEEGAPVRAIHRKLLAFLQYRRAKDLRRGIIHVMHYDAP